MIGYMVFSPDWKIKNSQYKVGETYMIKGKLTARKGFRFCKKVIDCFNYLNKFDPNCKVAEITIQGSTISVNSISYTDKINIIREISWSELLEMVNYGKGNAGIGNIGNKNSGNTNDGSSNVGDCNTGNCNTGKYNTGFDNTGNFNTGSSNVGNGNNGYYNVGSNNIGNYNVGDLNRGHRNTGSNNVGNGNVFDWNNTSYSAGCFMTQAQPFMMFNKPTEWTHKDWYTSKAYFLLNDLAYSINRCRIKQNSQGNNENEDSLSNVAQTWWDTLSDTNKSYITELPNFDADIFHICTGIQIDIK